MMPWWALFVLQPIVPTSSGVHALTLGRVDAPDVVYTLSIPPSFDPDTAHPLVIALHYGGIHGQHFGRGILTGLVEPGLRSLNAIIAAPDSRSGWSNEDGEAIALDLLDFLTQQYRVDPKRVILAGYSLGGMGTWYIASQNPERFTAAIPMAGAPRNVSDEDLRALVSLPLYAIHSLADTVVPIGPTEKAIETLRAADAEHVVFDVVDAVPHYSVPGFVPYLRNAAAWLERTWAER